MQQDAQQKAQLAQYQVSRLTGGVGRAGAMLAALVVLLLGGVVLWAWQPAAQLRVAPGLPWSLPPSRLPAILLNHTAA